MTWKLHRSPSWACLMIAALVAPAFAQTDDDKVSRLEALLESQQQQIEQLEQQVAAVNSASLNQERAEAMKQQIREVLGEREFREQLMSSTMQAGYDHGFYIRSSDDKFSMKFNGRMQFRWTHYNTRTENRYLRPGNRRGDRTGFDIERARFKITGHAYDEDLTYNLTMRADEPDRWNFVIHYFWVNYRMRDEIQFRAGIFRLASTRSQVTSDALFQFVDRPMVDAVFGLGIGQGVRFWGRLFDKQLDWYLDIVNALRSPMNRTITPDPREHDNNPAILVRLVWHILSDDDENPGSEFLYDADLTKHDSPALDFGFHYAFNNDDGDRFTVRIPFKRQRRFRGGGFGLVSTNGLQTNQFGSDLAFKWMGFSAMGEYIIRIVDPIRGGFPFTAPWVLATRQRDTTVQHGAYVQFGYFLPIPGLEDKLEAVARIGGISTLANGQEGTWEYAGGLNYYIEGHDVKVQMDVTKISEVPISDSYSSLANVNDDALIFRVQLQVAF